jgi:hypothetical protein
MRTLDILESDPNLLKHEVVKDNILLTASTKQLQEFVEKHISDENFFEEKLILKRLDAEDANEPNDIEPNEDLERTGYYKE